MLPHRAGAGLGLRLPHLADVLAHPPEVPFFEVHPESFLANPHATELLLTIADRHPISVHTVGVSIGSACGVDHAHLARVKQLVDVVNPVLLSGHVAWSTHAGEYLNDLLPLPYNEESLRLLVSHVREVQDVFERPYLVENPSSYVGFGTSTMTEPAFLTALVSETGCRLLCDVSNVYLSAHNLRFDAQAYMDALPAAAIAELHLGGFEAEPDESIAGATLLVDTHGTSIDPGVWRLYEYAIARFGPVPTLLERDNDIPDFDVLLAESRLVRSHAAAAVALRHAHAG